MSENTNFKSNWASHPGETIADILDERCLSVEDFAKDLGATTEFARALLDGRVGITSELAGKLVSLLGASASFWMAR